MGVIILDKIKFSIDKDELLKKCHLSPEREEAKEVIGLAEQAELLGRPKAVYIEALVEEWNPEYVKVTGGTLKSRMVSAFLENTEVIFPFVATCGEELEQWWSQLDDILLNYWGERIIESALNSACNAFEQSLYDNYMKEFALALYPGAIDDWPMCEQQTLFSLLGDVEKMIGVTLNENYIMRPLKSVCGVRFSSAALMKDR